VFCFSNSCIFFHCQSFILKALLFTEVQSKSSDKFSNETVLSLRLSNWTSGETEMGDLATYFWIAVAAIILLVDLWVMVSVFRSDKSDAVKVLWALILLVLPVVGLAIWGVAGPRGIKRGTGPTSPEHSKG